MNKTFTRNKLYLAIEAVGLVISFTVFIILMSQVWYDVSFDKVYPDSHRIYLFERPQSRTGRPEPYQYLMNRPQIAAIRDASPDVDAVGSMFETLILDTESDTPIESVHAVLVDDDFVKVFLFHMVAGSQDGFDRPESVLLTESAAFRLFGGSTRAVGQALPIVKGQSVEQGTVIGVCKDFPVNSSFAKIGVFGQMGDLYAADNDPNYESVSSFVKLRKGANPAIVAPVLASAFEKNWVLWESADTPSDIRQRTLSESLLVSLHDAHYDTWMNGTGNRTRNAVLSAIALIFLLVGLLNILNLSMAELPFHIQGNCIRKIFGAGQGNLLAKDMASAAVLCVISFLIALFITVIVSNSPLASLLTVPLYLNGLLPVILICFVIAMAGSVLATYIPSRYGNSYSPVAVLKGRISLSGRGKEFRVGTLAFQYLLSFVFIIVGLMIGVQNRYVTNYDLGFQTKDIDYAYMGFATSAKYETVREALLQDNDITDVTFSNIPLLTNNPTRQTREVDGTSVRFTGLDVTADYLDFFGFKVVDGRGFSEEDGSASTGAFVVNEAFMRAYPDLSVGARMKGIRQGYPGNDAVIVGVVKDFHFQDLKHPVEPFAFYCSGEESRSNDINPRYFRVAVKTVSGKAGEVAGRLVPLLNGFSEGMDDARCESLEQTAQQFYRGNAAESMLVRISSILSLTLALLGIFGLLFLEIQAIRKSVAIRKLWGASTGQLSWMLLRKYLILGTLIFIASVPMGIWIIGRWQEQFAEQAAIPVWIFLAAWLLVIGTTVAVIASLMITIVRMNPAVELKKE